MRMLRHLPDQRPSIGRRHLIHRFYLFPGIDSALETGEEFFVLG